ncbi:MAG TPA: hypothetical protein VJH95_00390 [Candidatus Nanoarchaeia archaeon]|nr:hypothetical protein [Candidatus Nanoarchaeia archaeon]
MATENELFGLYFKIGSLYQRLSSACPGDELLKYIKPSPTRDLSQLPSVDLEGEFTARFGSGGEEDDLASRLENYAGALSKRLEEVSLGLGKVNLDPLLRKIFGMECID